MLDTILVDGASLQQRLGVADKQRVEQHLEAIRAIEKRLDTMPRRRTSAVCESLTAPTVGKDDRSEAPPAVNTAMVELSRSRACVRAGRAFYVHVLAARRARLLPAPAPT